MLTNALAKEQRDVTNLVLRALAGLRFDDVVVAGGAPRDWYFNKPATDIDVFIHSVLPIASETFITLLASVGVPCKVMEHEEITKSYANPHIDEVFEATLLNVKFQFILVNAPLKIVISTFPVNMSLIYYKNGQVFPYRSFMIGVNHKALIRMTKGHGDREKYVNKIICKFPGYDFYESWGTFKEFSGVDYVG